VILTGVLIVVAVAIAGVIVYNRFVRYRNRVETAWSDIDVQLQRRHDLIPRLVTAVDQYAKYERATLEAVTRLRAEAMQAAEAGIDERGEAEEKLTAGVLKLLAVAEHYPDLEASRNFRELTDELVRTENFLQFARRYYNGAVRDYNTFVESFPSNVVAGLFGFRLRSFFQKTADEAAAVPLVEFGSVE